MLTIKNQAWKVLVVFAALAWLLAGCTPAGPKALLQGQKLLEKGDYPAALEKLKKAVTLLPDNANAWNYLGLAHHHSGQAADAANAYRRALRLDPDLAEARFNLGCLWLEQNRPELAKNELMAFTLQREKDADGFVKLGTAQLRCREVSGAEKSFSEALRLRPKDAEALTGLGLTRLQRGRVAEAALYFNSALKETPGYPPALLNLAMVAHYQMHDKQLALQKYREYAAAGHVFEAEKVRAAIRQLEQELAPAPAPMASAGPPTNRVSQTPQVAQAAKAVEPGPDQPQTKSPSPAKENGAPVAQTQTRNAEPAPAAGATTARRGTDTPSAPTTIARRSDESPASSKPAPPPTEKNTQPPVAKSVVAAKTPAQTSPQMPPARAAETPRKEPAPPPEKVILPAEPVIRPAQDVTMAKPPAPAPEPRQTPVAARKSEPPPPEPKRGFFQKLNPANLFGKDDSAASSSTDNSPGRGTRVYKPNQPEDILNGATPRNEAPVVLLRYTYLSPAKPPAGDREKAEAEFAEGVQAHKAGQLGKATEAYRRATQADPGYFDPYYNLGLAAARTGDLVMALAAYETALAIRPESLDARYNFALALKQADYYLDAASELERLLREYPNEARAHLALGNLYAQQLKNFPKARVHYLKVLEIEPRHPQAGAIRYWLMDHPE